MRLHSCRPKAVQVSCGGERLQGWLTLSLGFLSFLPYLGVSTSSRLRARDAELAKGFPIATNGFLLMSSPSEKRVLYVVVDSSTNKAVGNTTRPLVDAGLDAPAGLALTVAGDGFFVADSSSEQIWYYGLEVVHCDGLAVSNVSNGFEDQGVTMPTAGSPCGEGMSLALKVTGPPVLIIHDVASSWVAVDPSNGALYYTDVATKSLNRIDKQVLDKIIAGELESDMLKVTEESGMDAFVAALKGAEPGTAEYDRLGRAVKDATDHAIIKVHDEKSDPFMGLPGGVALMDGDVYWANEAEGMTKGSLTFAPSSKALASLAQRANSGRTSSWVGSVVAMTGNATVKAEIDSPIRDQSFSVGNITESSFGVAVTHDMAMFSASEHIVYGVSRLGHDAVVPLTDALSTPKGLAWDGDHTVFVADHRANAIYAIQCGRLAQGPEPTLVVEFPGPFGLAYLKLQQEHVEAQTSWIEWFLG